MPIDLASLREVEAPHPQYRAHLKDLGDRILRVREIAADNEEEAFRQLHAMTDGRPLELWKGRNLLARLDASGNRET